MGRDRPFTDKLRAACCIGHKHCLTRSVCCRSSGYRSTSLSSPSSSFSIGGAAHRAEHWSRGSVTGASTTRSRACCHEVPVYVNVESLGEDYCIPYHDVVICVHVENLGRRLVLQGEGRYG